MPYMGFHLPTQVTCIEAILVDGGKAEIMTLSFPQKAWLGLVVWISRCSGLPHLPGLKSKTKTTNPNHQPTGPLTPALRIQRATKAGLAKPPNPPKKNAKGQTAGQRKHPEPYSDSAGAVVEPTKQKHPAPLFVHRPGLSQQPKPRRLSPPWP